MIDDRKIEEAKEEIYEDRFLLNGTDVVFDNDDKEEMFYKEDIKEAIGLGAKWAINELLKDLWHPANEEPEKNRRCLIRVVYHLNYGMLPDEERIEQSSFHDFGWYDYDFKYIGVDYDIVSYLYVDELLPKKGGNHD